MEERETEKERQINTKCCRYFKDIVFSFAKPQDNAFLYSDKATVFNKYEYIFGPWSMI